jgi:hypothetical protein
MFSAIDEALELKKLQQVELQELQELQVTNKKLHEEQLKKLKEKHAEASQNLKDKTKQSDKNTVLVKSQFQLPIEVWQRNLSCQTLDRYLLFILQIANNLWSGKRLSNRCLRL